MKEQVTIMHAVAAEDAPEFAVSGTAQEGRDHTLRLCLANSRLTFAGSTVFAAPLLHITKTEPGGVHFYGMSSCGKSTVLDVAASIVGNPAESVRGWHSTGAAIEAIAARCNDGVLILDELGQCHPDAAATVVYTLTSGGGKRRADQRGDLREHHRFRVLLLSSGEMSFPDFLRQAGKKPFAGQELRLLDIPADAGCGMGIFEHLHDSPDPAAFADRLKRATKQHHGVVFREYLQHLVNDINDDYDGTLRKINAYIKDFFAAAVEVLPPGYSGQIHRAATRFGLIAAGGELGSSYGVSGWDYGEALWAAKVCFNAWLSRRDTTGQQELHTLIHQLRAFLEAHAESRFTLLDSGHKAPNAKTLNRCGWRQVTVDASGDTSHTEFFISTTAFKEIVTGFDWKWAANVLVAQGIIKPNPKTGDATITKHIPNEGTMRVYHVPAFTEEADEGEKEACQ